MHRAQERFSTWTFVQAFRGANSPRLANPVHRLLGCNCPVSQALRQTLRSNWILVGYPNMASGKYEETIQFGWSTISEILRSTTRLAST
jgi:hypothetical protein